MRRIRDAVMSTVVPAGPPGAGISPGVSSGSAEVAVRGPLVVGPGGRSARGGDRSPEGWRSSLVLAATVWTVGVLGYIVITWISWARSGPSLGSRAGHGGVLHSWERWDTLWYEHIARAGYASRPAGAAFFPLYPMLVRAVDVVLPGGTFTAALAVSLAAYYAALVVTHRLTALLRGERLARRTVCYLVAFPTGFFLAAAYNESLFIAVAAASLYCMHRGRWWSAGGWAALAGATRLSGIFLVVALAYEYLRQRGFAWRAIRADALAVAVAPLGVVAYAAYCWRVFGDPLYFQKAQAGWHRAGAVMPWTTARRMIDLITRSRPRIGEVSIMNTVSLGTALLVVVLLCWALVGGLPSGREHVYVVLFSGLSFLMPVVFPMHTSYPLNSIWRYALECLPVFMVLARVGDHRMVDRIYLFVTLPVQALMLYTFVQGGFIA